MTRSGSKKPILTGKYISQSLGAHSVFFSIDVCGNSIADIPGII